MSVSYMYVRLRNLFYHLSIIYLSRFFFAVSTKPCTNLFLNIQDFFGRKRKLAQWKWAYCHILVSQDFSQVQRCWIQCPLQRWYFEKTWLAYGPGIQSNAMVNASWSECCRYCYFPVVARYYFVSVIPLVY